MDLVEVIKFLELLTVLVVLFHFKKYKEAYFKCFFVYALVLFTFEILIYFFFKKNNIHIYNIYTFFEFNLVATIYYFLNKEKLSLTLMKYSMIVFNIVYFISFYFTSLQAYTTILGALIVSVFMILYLKELLNSSKIIDYRIDLSFWITVGMLFYYLTTIPFLTLVYVIGMKSPLLFYIIHIITIITHLCFIYGLIWSRKTAI
jgi:hypothetical protein